MVKLPETPELDRQHDVQEECRTLSAFLDWLRDDQRISLMKWGTEHWEDPCPRADLGGRGLDNRICLEGRDVSVFRGSHWEVSRVTEDHGPCATCGGMGYVPRQREAWIHDGRDFNTLLADYFGIDLHKIDSERRALLDAIRAADGD